MSTDNTVQTNLEGEKVYPHKCKWCGKPFTKQHNRQEYCSDECFNYARLEQKAIYQRKRRKLINNNELVSNESRHLGTGYLSQHRHEDFEKEHASIQKELKRIRG
ncbi:MAG: hypothetical protein Q4Q32_03820 [Methanobrevibacter sp.]|nr:hypothetical protein [Methanobrevibacter sp.]